MKNLLAKIFSPKPEIIRQVVISYLQKLPDVVSVAFKKDDDLLIGRIQLKGDEDPIYIQAQNPAEFTKMLNEAIYVTFDFKSEYIDFFHKRGDHYGPTPEAKKALDDLYGKRSTSMSSDFQHAFGFESIDEQKLISATT